MENSLRQNKTFANNVYNSLLVIGFLRQIKLNLNIDFIYDNSAEFSQRNHNTEPLAIIYDEKDFNNISDYFIKLFEKRI